MRPHLSTLRMLRDACVVAVVAVLTVQSMRKWCGDRYLVPSDSMQPVLFGDPVDGDVVFVNKLGSANDRQRGDLVVVADRDKPGHQLVKRIAACGDDPNERFLDIRNGDLLLGPNRQQLRRVQKDPVAAMTRSVSWGALPGSEDARRVIDMASVSGDGPWLLQPLASVLADARPAYRPRARRERHRDPVDGVLPARAMGTNRPVDCSYLDIRGLRSLNGDDKTVVDCGMALRFGAPPLLSSSGIVLCTIDSAEFATTFVWDAANRRVSLWHDARLSGSLDLPAGDWRGALTFGRLDGRDFLLLDGERVMLEPLPSRFEVHAPRRTYVHVAVVGDQPAMIQSLRVFRDVFSWRQRELGVPGGDSKWPVYVEKGTWFLLGDNAFDSRDSRQFGPVKLSKYVGVPSGVIGPWARQRWLTR